MNILIVTYRLPQPQFGGGTRNYHLLRALAREHRVALLTLLPANEASKSAPTELERLTHTVRTVRLPSLRRRRLHQVASIALGRSYFLTFHSPASAQPVLDELLGRERYDVVLFEGVALAGYRLPPGVRAIIDQHNIEHELLRRSYQHTTSWARRWFERLEYPPQRRGELARCREADAVLVCSERERRVLERLVPGCRVCVVPNGVDLDTSEAFDQRSTTQETPGRVIFTGTMSYHANVDAAILFAQHCWPAIRAAVPEATWQIVGSDPPEAVQRLATLPGVSVTGYVPAVQPYLDSAAVAIAPLRIGGGTRLKILEALAMRKAVVTTSLGCEGLEVSPGRDLLVEDDLDAFASAVIAALSQHELRSALGSSGRRLVEERYSWEHSGQQLLRVLEESGTWMGGYDGRAAIGRDASSGRGSHRAARALSLRRRALSYSHEAPAGARPPQSEHGETTGDVSQLRHSGPSAR